MNCVDPVCGMEIDMSEAKSYEYKGQTYHFCSDSCKKQFIKDPSAYVKEDMGGMEKNNC